MSGQERWLHCCATTYRWEIRAMESTSIDQHLYPDETTESDSTAFDKLREECGVVAVHGHPDAARQAYLALYALQHHGHGVGGGYLYRRGAVKTARRIVHRPHSLFDHRRLGAAERAAYPGGFDA